MAKAMRIDSYTVDGAGKVTIEFTVGTSPLPAGPMRMGFVFQDVQAIKDILDDVDNREIFETLFKIGMARFRSVNAAMTNGALIQGRTITYDVTQSANQVVIS